jgi:hypothetical protein
MPIWKMKSIEAIVWDLQYQFSWKSILHYD